MRTPSKRWPNQFRLSVGDRIRITKNFRSGEKKFRNKRATHCDRDRRWQAHGGEGQIIPRGALHIDQGFVVTSHASQGKTVDQVIVSVPVNSFSQANEAQFYVSMSRARAAMHLFTDSKVALREAVTKPSSRLSPWELIANSTERRKEKEVIAQIQSASKSLRGRGVDPYIDNLWIKPRKEL